MKEKMKKVLRRNSKLYRLMRKYYGVRKPLQYLLHDKRGWNYLRCHFSAIRKSEKSLGRPMLLTIEPTNTCDQKCTICETGLGILGRRREMMSFEAFKYILDQFDENLRIIYFYFMGESFLNKDAYKMIRYAADRGIYVHACTNGNRIDSDALVKSGIADIQFQIAGTTADVHAKYRAGSDLNKVLHNVRETLKFRDKFGNNVRRPYRMRVGLNFILLKPNEHQVEDFHKMAEELGVDEYQIIDPCVRSLGQAKELLPTDKNHWIYDPEAFEEGELRPRIRPDNFCEWIYTTVTILVNGDLVPCCRDPLGKRILGNVFNDHIYRIWNNSRYCELRKAVCSVQRKMELCRLCEGYGISANELLAKTNI